MFNTHSNSQHSSRSSIDAAQRSSLRRFLHDDRGMTTIEYAVLLAVIVVGGIGLWTQIGDELMKMLGEAIKALQKAQESGTGTGAEGG